MRYLMTLVRLIVNRRSCETSKYCLSVVKLSGLLIVGVFFPIGDEAMAETFYISPGGSNSSPGTSSSPWKTFDFALKRLQPGDILILKDGTYTTSTTGLAYILCGPKNAVSGKAGSPITIMAENERKAFIKSDGSKAALSMKYCSYWNVIGIRGESTDKSSGTSQAVFNFDDVSNVNIKRALAAKPNRYYNTHGISITGSSNLLIEESEVYWFHRWGIVTVKSHNITFRRNYVNSRGYSNVSGGWDSIRDDGGDFGIGGYPSGGTKHLIIENCISDDGGGGFQAGKNTNDGIFTKILGSIAIGGVGTGLQSETKDSGGSYNVLVENFVGIRNGNGIRNRAVDNMEIRNATLYSNSQIGIAADDPKTIGSVRTYSLNVLSFKNSKKGFSLLDQNDWLIGDSNSHGNGAAEYPSGETIGDNSGKIRNSMSVQPTGMGLGQGQCIVYVPSTSNMKGAGKDGADIGANIIYRYENGVLTSKKLWNQSTGQFPCGATVKGVNDIAGDSCFDVHKRLNVGVNGCPIP